VRATILTVALIVAAATAMALPQVDVPLEHWSYEFMERLVVRAGLGGTHLDLKPLTRGEMAVLVERLSAADWQPTRIESEQLAMLRAEFSEELRARGDSIPLLERAYHLWSGDAWKLQAFWRGRERGQLLDPDLSPAGSQLQGDVTFEPAAALVLADHVLAAVQVRYRVRTGTGTFVNSTDVRDGEAEYVFEPRDRFSVVRAVDATLRYDGGLRWRAGIERGRLRWGPARHDPMLIADASPPLDMLRYQVALGPVRFGGLAGQLRPAQLAPTDPPLVERYVSAHRLEVAATSWLDVAVSEALIWGDRGLDLAYLNPLAVLYVSQANIGDLDNALGSLDVGLRLGRSARLYGECVIDDLNLRRGLEDFGNKVGVAMGFLWQAPFGAADWDVDGEYSWASQFTYTHDQPIDRYEHYGATFGSRIGPDADLWVAGVRRRLTRSWWVRAFYELERHGEGNLATGDNERTSEDQQYLSGVTESRHEPGLQLRYSGLRSLDLEAEYRYLLAENPHNDPMAPDARRQEVRVEARVEF
jgi:hypothetical protein